MAHSIGIKELNKLFKAVGDTVTLVDVRRRADDEPTPPKKLRVPYGDISKKYYFPTPFFPAISTEDLLICIELLLRQLLFE